jgi:recombination protein RecT
LDLPTNNSEEEMSNALTIVTGAIQDARDSFASVLVDRSLNFEREAGFAIQILGGKDYTLKVAADNRQSVIDAVTNIAAIGISLNPAKRQAYLVPRKDGNGGVKICLDISYIGLLDLAITSGSIMWGQAELVHQNDPFTLNGFDQPPTHGRNPFANDRGPVIGAYVVVKTRDGDYLTTCMQIDEINGIRDRSEGWKAYKDNKIKSTPWSTDPGEMAKKTVIKRAYKLWPKTDRLDQAIHFLNNEGGEGLGFEPAPARPANWIDVTPMIAEAVATTTDLDALNYWKQNNHKLAKQPADHDKLKQAVAAHRLALKQKDDARTVEMQPTGKKPDLTGLTADMDAAADEGIEPFMAAWNRLSPQTQALLADEFDRFKTKAEKKGVPA